MPEWGSTTTLVGREQELAALREFVVDSAADGGCILVVGDAGIGKSVLLESAGAYAATVGVRVLRAAGVEFEAEVSFAGLHQLLAPLAAELSALPDTQRHAVGVSLGLEDGSPSDQLTLVNAVIALLVHAGGEGAVLLLVDDLQWLDYASANVLALVARRLAGARVGFVGVVRTGEGSIFETAGLPEIEVRPLHADAATALLTHAYPELVPRDVSQVLADAQGNPLALIELPTQVGAGAGDAGLPRTPVGRRLQLHFERRIDPLPPHTREQLLLTALDGSSGLFPPVSVTDLEPAEKARLIRVHPVSHEVQFRHPLTRAAVVELSTDAERRWAHGRLAERHADDSRRRAWHLAEAATGPDESIAQLLEDAAFTTKDRGDPVGAIGLLIRAAELSPGTADNVRRAMVATYLGADITGDLTDPQLVAAGTIPGESRSVAAAVAAAAYMVNGGGDVDTIHRLLLGALRSVAAPVDAWDRLLIEIVYVLESNCSFGARVDLVADYHAAVERLGIPLPEILQLLGDTFLEPVAFALPALAHLDEAIALIDDGTDHAHTVRLGIAAMYVDRIPGCRTALVRVVEHGRAGGAIASAIKAFALLGFDGLHNGDWDETLRLAEEGIALTARYNYRLLGGFLQYDQAMIAAARGDRDLVNSLAGDLIGWAAPNRIEFVVQLAAHAKSLAALGNGEYETAYRHALQICSPGTVASYKPAALWVLLDLVESAVRSGRLDEARAHVVDIEAANVAAISPRLALITAGAIALISPDTAFREAYESALAAPDVGRWPFAQARIRLAYGERLRRAKATTEARAVLIEALDAFERLGAVPWATRTRAELRASGLAPNRTDPGAITDLTPQQREIAELAAAGLSNKQIGERLFLSPRTVGAHLYQLFPKLGITSRAALRDALKQQPGRQSMS
ncbi:helix-turn-helix transcriptional regulator [Diaminobutyricibacter sp. McL0618]|uniref:helix-turn-helix transcriptional regulator n=1 Tax=Leifsonia sp. McL0618 TaxID=3415677 RepID=UPI003CE74EE1